MGSPPWQPTQFQRFIRSFASSTFPAQIQTDLGNAYIKVINNPLGPHALIRDWVGTGLARWFGLPTFDYAILRLSEADEIPLHDGRAAEAGPAFVTRAVEGHPWGGAEEELELLDNPETISWLVVFDTWIRNADRYAPEDLAPQNAHEDNVFLTGEGATQGRLRLLAIDHTECFTSTATELSTRIAAIDNIKDPRVYGLFPQFRRFLDGTQLHAAAERLRTVDAQTISNILRGVPREWDLAPTAHLALARFIEERARFVAGPDMVDKLMSFRVPSQSLLC